MKHRLAIFTSVAILSLALLVRAQDEGSNGTCRDENGVDIKCSDGHYHDGYGHVQPDTCDNNHFEDDGKTVKPESHKCQCVIATTDADHCPMDGLKKDYSHMGPTCKTSCRDNDCKCVNLCDFTANEVKPLVPPAPAAKKPATKGKKK